MRRKGPEKWRTQNLFLIYDNAPAHRSVLIKIFSTENNVATLEPPPYPPDLVPAEFYLFPRLKSALKGRRFCDATDIIKNTTEEPKRLPGMFPALSQWLAEVYSSTRRLFWRNCSLINCIILYFSEINLFRGHFEATTYNTWQNTSPTLDLSRKASVRCQYILPSPSL